MKGTIGQLGLNLKVLMKVIINYKYFIISLIVILTTVNSVIVFNVLPFVELSANNHTSDGDFFVIGLLFLGAIITAIGLSRFYTKTQFEPFALFYQL